MNFNKKDNDKLLNCPFCGGKSEIRTTDEYFGIERIDIAYVECVKCHCRSRQYRDRLHMGEEFVLQTLLNYWNTRKE